MHPLICTHCGEWDETPDTGAGVSVLRCASCGRTRPFLRMPLYCVSGPSGTGKSTIAGLLLERLRDRFVVLEQDLLWVSGLRDPEGHHRHFRSTWLRTAAMVQQSGRPVVLCGTVVPPEFEPLPERALFTDIHYLALSCEPGALAERLRARPAWREWDEERIDDNADFAAWVAAEAARLDPPMTLVDTTHTAPADTADAVCRWIEGLAAAEAAAG
ncbi:AAA family ATPase [Nocardiopsis sp. CA-288880]|uniref:AAA family ATPase n=1 Tax=Nocardiopsis sp. CA-288880 TaxID=3239995 RepID=UPI003D97ED3A